MKIAVIPARKGSKRILKKNIRDFCGSPMISYAINAAKLAGIFDRIIVSTDCPEISEIANELGAETPFIRPDDLSDDFVGTGAVVVHALKWMEENGYDVDLVCCIYATVPLISEDDIKLGLSLLANTEEKLYAFSVTDFAFPVHRAMLIANDQLRPLFPEHLGTRSQDLPEVVHDAGMFYWGRPKGFLEGVPMFGPDSIPVKIPRYRVLDIDTPEDWVQAELMYQALKNRKVEGRPE
jgi:N-acylneuraminate cytidylyltransferase